jgi:hypothetical protein
MSEHPHNIWAHWDSFTQGFSTFPAWLKGMIIICMVLLPSHAGHAHRWLPGESTLKRGHLVLKYHVCMLMSCMHAWVSGCNRHIRGRHAVYTTHATITIITISNIAQHLVKSMLFI